MLNMDGKRLRSLDILRGLAILMVFASHVDPRTSEVIGQLSGPASFAFWFFHRVGRTGVELFFILSGFLIGGLLFRETAGTGRIDIWRFWIRRGFKIWPSYWLLLLVLALTGTTGYIDTRTLGTALQSAAMHLFFLQNYLPDNPNGPTWSLAVEEHFYLFLPLLLGALLAFARWRKTDWRRYVGRLTVAVVLVCLAFRVANLLSGMHPWDFALTQNRLDALMIGVFSRFLVFSESGIVARLMKRRFTWLFLATLFIVPAGLVEREHPFMFSVGFVLLSIGYAIVMLLVYGGLLRRFEKGPLLTGVAKVGTWSYNIYLWHVFVPLIPFPLYAEIHGFIIAQVTQPLLQLGLQTLLFVSYAILVGFVATKVIEEPILRLRNRWFPSREKAVEAAN